MGIDPGPGAPPNPPQEGNQPPGAPPAAPPPSTPPTEDPKTFDAEYVSKLRNEAADNRTKLKAAQDELKKLQDAQLSDQEKAVKRATEAEARAQAAEAKVKERTVRADVKLAAAKLNVVDPDAAYKLLDLDQITFNEAGDPTNIDKLIGQLVKDKPYLVGANGSHSSANPQTGHGGSLTVEDIRKMSSDEINRRWDEIQKVLAK